MDFGIKNMIVSYYTQNGLPNGAWSKGKITLGAIAIVGTVSAAVAAAGVFGVASIAALAAKETLITVAAGSAGTALITDLSLLILKIKHSRATRQWKARELELAREPKREELLAAPVQTPDQSNIKQPLPQQQPAVEAVQHETVTPQLNIPGLCSLSDVFYSRKEESLPVKNEAVQVAHQDQQLESPPAALAFDPESVKPASKAVMPTDHIQENHIFLGYHGYIAPQQGVWGF